MTESEEVCSPMVNSTVLFRILNKISSTSGIEDIVILNSAGEVIAYNGTDERKFVDVISAVTSNLWLILESEGETALDSDELKYVWFDCENGKIFVSKIDKFLLYIRSQQKIGFGFLKESSIQIRKYFEKWMGMIKV